MEGTGDGSSAANGAGTGVTWLSRTGGTNASDLWTNAGGDFATNILAVVPGYDATVTGVQKTFASSSNFVSTAQAAVNAGQPLNLMVLSPATETGANNYLSRLSSNDSPITAQRPQLTLIFLGNLAPAVAVSNAFLVLTNIPLSLSASVSNATGTWWSLVSGPAAVSFGNAAQPATVATFGMAGNYVLRLTASNALAQITRDIAVNVLATRPRLTAKLAGTGNCTLQTTGATGLNCTIQVSTNLVAWMNLLVTNLAAPVLVWTDSFAGKLPARYYRAYLGP